jgi:hypothetical protein
MSGGRAFEHPMYALNCLRLQGATGVCASAPGDQVTVTYLDRDSFSAFSSRPREILRAGDLCGASLGADPALNRP